MLLCMLLLLRGATESARVNAIMVLIKLGVLVLFVIIIALTQPALRRPLSFRLFSLGVELGEVEETIVKHRVSPFTATFLVLPLFQG